MKDFMAVLNNEYSRRRNSKPQGGVYEHFVCVRIGDSSDNGWINSQPYRLTFFKKQFGAIEVREVGRGVRKIYGNLDALFQEWLTPAEIRIYYEYYPHESKIYQGNSM